jgi:hypothetical protein
MTMSPLHGFCNGLHCLDCFVQAAADVLAMASLEVDLSGISEGEVRGQQQQQQ